MNALAKLALVLCVASCNSILGIKDLSEAEPDGDGGSDGPSGSASIRFLLVTPDIFRLDPDGMASIREVGGPELVRAQYGRPTSFVDLPLDTTSLEIRRGDGEVVLATVSLVYDRSPTAPGERITAVVAGTLQPTAGEEPAGALAFSELTFDGTVSGAEWRLVNAVTDRSDEPLNYSIAYPTEVAAAQPLGPILSAATPEPLVQQQAFRLRVGLGVTQGPGTEDCSFSVPAQPADARLLLVLGGLIHVDASEEPGLMLYVVPFDGAASFVRQDPAFYVANFYQDYSNDTMWLADLNTSVPLSRQSTQRIEPMIVFNRPLVAQGVTITGLGGTANLTLPATPAGTRVFIGLRGFVEGGTPGPTTTTITPIGEPPTSETQLSFVHATPDPATIDVVATNTGDLVDVNVATGLTYGSVASTELRSGPNDVRIFAPGETTAISTFPAEILGLRQIFVLHGKQNPVGLEESLRLTPVDMRMWPWQIRTSVASQ
ncbi:MAG: hypothetical protein F9K40_01800 [Kofleriaceae bacterium]|nr:MAG: hypothetical protein F9K40_01800 [Kofleriaceae bacterium]MBZ0235796.1 DUF4397 domain-containing protein [Kofleriaceae bacterium]